MVSFGVGLLLGVLVVLVYKQANLYYQRWWPEKKKPVLVKPYEDVIGIDGDFYVIVRMHRDLTTGAKTIELIDQGTFERNYGI